MPSLERTTFTSSISLLSVHQSLEDQYIPTPDMSLKKRIQSLSPEGRRRRKLSQESATSAKHQGHAKCSSEAIPASRNTQGPTTVHTFSPDPHSDESARTRDRVQHWFDLQAQRFNQIKLGFRRHRDSMFSQEDIEKELKMLSKEANAEIPGPDGKPVDKRVIERFFERYPACESDWPGSTRWERFQASCLVELRAEDHFHKLYPYYGEGWNRTQVWEAHRRLCLEERCLICVSSPPPRKRSFSSSRMSSSSVARSIPPGSTKPPRRTSLFKDRSAFTLTKWRSRSPKREDKGKSPADEEEAQPVLNYFVTKPITELEDTSPQGPRTLSRPNPVIVKRIQHIQQQPIRYSGTNKTLDPYQIAVPAPEDLKPADSSAFNPADLSHMTGRPYSPCPLEEGRLPFPLSRNTLSAPGVQEGHRISAVPAHMLLRDASRASSNDGVFAMSPPSSPASSTTDVARVFESTIRLVNAEVDEVRALLNDIGDEVAMPTLKGRRAVPARTHPRHRKAVVFPPTPPASRPGSGSYGSERGSPRGSLSGSGSKRNADQRLTAYAAALAPVGKSRAELRMSSGRYVAQRERREVGGLGQRRAVRQG